MQINEPRIGSLFFFLLTTLSLLQPLLAFSNSSMNNFFRKLESRVASIDSLLCVGLDPHAKEVFPEGWDDVNEEERCDAAFKFCKRIIDATGEAEVMIM